jgi:hypothetical protein
MGIRCWSVPRLPGGKSVCANPVCASAKTKPDKNDILFIMNNMIEISDTSVESVLKSTPKAARLFIDWHTTCVGCGFARFCTLKDVINAYHLNGKLFLEELAKIDTQKYQ